MLQPHAGGDRITRSGREGASGVTLRAVLLAFVTIIGIAVAAFYLNLRQMTVRQFGAGVPASAPFTALFLLTALASIPALKRRLRFTRQELLTIYAIILMGAPLVSMEVLCWMLSHSIAQQYLARAIPEWQTGFLQLVPTWFTPTEAAAVESFYLGHASVPWSLWWTPLAAWCSFLIALVVASCSLTALVQRQWIQNERLSFPLAEVPLETVSESEAGPGGRSAGLALVWMFWIGLLVSFSIGFYNSVAQWVPTMRAIPIGPVTVVPWQNVGPLAGLGDIDIVLYPWLIALGYLLPKELSFSCWFFWWSRVSLTMLAIAAGATPQRPDEWFGNDFPAPYWQGVGAVLALAAWTAWTARRHLARAVRVAFSSGSGDADAGEPIPYRWALLAFALSFAWMVCFCWLAGSRLQVAVALIGLILVFFLMWARLRAETGMGFLSFPLKVEAVMLGTFGSTIFKPQEVVMIVSARWAYYPGYGKSSDIFPGNAIEAFKVADAARIGKRRLTAAMAAGFMLALVFGVYVTLTGIYHYGFLGLRGGTELGEQLYGDGARIFNELQNPSPFEPATGLALGAGAAFAIFLGMMRQRFWWWPFHPIGYLASNTWSMKWDWMPLFVGWLAKALVIRFGGLRLYRATIPLAIGLIGGDLLNQVVWGAIQAIARRAG